MPWPRSEISRIFIYSTWNIPWGIYVRSLWSQAGFRGAADRGLMASQAERGNEVGHAAADPADYAFTPAPVRGAAAGSSGQRGRGAKPSPSTRPRRSRSSPAQATIAPLSVQSFGGGTAKANPCA